MPISIDRNTVFTLDELEHLLRQSGDLQPRKTIRVLREQGLVVTAKKLILGSALLGALEKPREDEQGGTK